MFLFARKSRWIFFALGCVLSSATWSQLFGLEPDYSEAVQESTDLIKVFLDSDEPLKHIAAYKWANAATQEQLGQLLFYLDKEGRPVASSKVQPWFNGPLAAMRVDQVMVAMTDQPLTFKYGDRVLWMSPPSEIEFKRLEAAPTPHASDSRRLSQSKALARDFTAQIGELGAKHASAERILRLLPTPVHRYGSGDYSKDGTIDGNLFVFIIGGGNPAIILFIEVAREADEVLWRYGLSRRGVDTLTVEHKGTKVWEVPRISDSSIQQSLYRIRDPR